MTNNSTRTSISILGGVGDSDASPAASPILLIPPPDAPCFHKQGFDSNKHADETPASWFYQYLKSEGNVNKIT
jgi:hypothetical protein